MDKTMWCEEDFPAPWKARVDKGVTYLPIYLLILQAAVAAGKGVTLWRKEQHRGFIIVGFCCVWNPTGRRVAVASSCTVGSVVGCPSARHTMVVLPAV